MKKQLFILVTLLSVVAGLQAQSFGELDFQKKKIPALITEVPYSASVTEDAIRQKFSQLGYSAKQNRGVYIYKGVKILELGEETLDVMIKVDRKSRKDRDESNVFLTVSRGYENYIKSTDDPEFIERMKKYCQSFIPLAEAQALEVEIEDQTSKVKSTEKKLKDYEDDSMTLQKRLRKIQEDIEENKQTIEKQKRDVENQKKALEVLKGKRKI